MIAWHRMLGLLLADLFDGSPWTVEIERDLSIKKQLVDIVVVRGGSGEFESQLPDGLSPMADHNLISYKSIHEPLTDWTLKELTGHYTNYRKQVSPSLKKLLSEDSFRMIGLCTRFPQKLAGQFTLEKRQKGIYEVQRGTDRIRIIVLNEIPPTPYNSLWHLFSGVPELIELGAANYQPHVDVSSVIQELFKGYQKRGLAMSLDLVELKRELDEKYQNELIDRYVKEKGEALLERFSREELLERFSREELLERFSREELLKQFTPDELRAYLNKLEKQENGQRQDDSQAEGH